jgi:hypothetical protein
VAGPGNFALEGWTQPYEVIQVDKDAGFVGEMRFILQRGTQGEAAETIHTIP